MGARTRKLFMTALMSGLEANGVKLSPRQCFDKAYALASIFNVNISNDKMKTIARQCSDRLAKM